eukprot:6491339-Amphidinium_carterae.4
MMQTLGFAFQGQTSNAELLGTNVLGLTYPSSDTPLTSNHVPYHSTHARREESACPKFFAGCIGVSMTDMFLNRVVSSDDKANFINVTSIPLTVGAVFIATQCL